MKEKFMLLDMNGGYMSFLKQDVPSSLMDFSPKRRFQLNGVDYIVIMALDHQQILCRNADTGDSEVLDIGILIASAVKTSVATDSDVVSVSDKDWQIAVRRYEIIRPLLEFDESKRQNSMVDSRAKECNVSSSTIRRWISRYTKSGKTSSLVPRKRRDTGNLRLDSCLETIIADSIRNVYMTKQQITPSHLIMEIKAVCHQKGINPPHPNTIRNRLHTIPKKLLHTKRKGIYREVHRYEPIKSSYEIPQWPLSVVQIDHTLADIILVDDWQRRPLGRPWLTLAMDVFSRMVVGVYVSLDAPSSSSVGICLANSILPKQGILIEHDIVADWPVWGMMDAIHVDNAKEFRGKMLSRSCNEYGINLNWRPVKKPHFGGHIERLMGTLGQEIHTLPGTTFSKPDERGGYNSDKQAALTLAEFYKWLLIHILKEYHCRIHKGIDSTPLEKYREGLKVRGIPQYQMDEERIKLDFMPTIERSIQRYGVSVDGVCYYHDSLRRWVGNVDKKKPRSFLFRRDPRDISKIWFFDPELEKYFPVPFRNNIYGATSLWEFRAAKSELHKRGDKSISEADIFKARDEMREVVKSALKNSKKARRQHQRLIVSTLQKKDKKTPLEDTSVIDYQALGIDISKIKPFPTEDI